MSFFNSSRLSSKKEASFHINSFYINGLYRTAFILFIFPFSWCYSPVLAEEIYAKLSAAGNEIEYNLTKASINNETSISFWIESSGIVSGGIALDISAPTGGTIEFFQSSNTKIAPEKIRSKDWHKLQLTNYDGSISPQTELINNIQYTSFRYYGILRKDACNPRVKKYYFKAKIGFKDIDKSSLPDNFSIKSRIIFQSYKGNKSGTIKPVSDGKYAPNPLILLSSLGSSSETLSLINWRNGKPTNPKSIEILDYVYYRGLSLTRSVASSILRGGKKATFEISDGFNSYAVCFKLTKKRQSVNGYPK